MQRVVQSQNHTMAIVQIRLRVGDLQTMMVDRHKARRESHLLFAASSISQLGAYVLESKENLALLV